MAARMAMPLVRPEELFGGGEVDAPRDSAPDSVACVLAAVWASEAGANGADAFDLVVIAAALFSSGAAAIAGDTVFGCIHDAAGSKGIFHAGRMKTRAGIVRWPITAAVQTA